MAISIKPKPSPKPLQTIAQKNTAAQAIGVETTMHQDGSEVSKQVPVGQPQMVPAAHAMVEVSIGVTRNLGNYESVKINVSLALPCLPEGAQIDEAYATAKGWVDSRIHELNEDIDADLGKNN